MGRRLKSIKLKAKKRGKIVTIRLYAKPPKGCSVPWQICLVCRKARIHKNDSRHKLKVCKACEAHAPTRTESQKKVE